MNAKLLEVFSVVTIISFVSAVPIQLKNEKSTPTYKCGLKNCPKIDPSKINIHLIAHSHDDVGWRQTFEDYYVGIDGMPSRDNARAGVQYIITSTVEALKNNPERRFIQVETAFLWEWWKNHNESLRQDFVDLVNNGQLEIINGAWSMNDEATAHYQSIIDQFSWGFRKLSENIGECATPKIGWQIDPFGHSREHASLLKQMGFDGLIIGRIDYRDKSERIKNKSLDFMWQTSANLDDTGLFTSMFPDQYMPVSGFCVDYACGGMSINDRNVNGKVRSFASYMDTYSNYYQTKNVIIPFGGDFHFQVAEVNFQSMDKLIEGFIGHSKYNVFYSSPFCYIKSVKDEIEENSLSLPEKSDDFFPYASAVHDYWTGYFTSRPTSKKFERTANHILQSLKQLGVFSKINQIDVQNSLDDLRAAMGIMQHHDAITGTEKQKVSDDYTRLLLEGITQAEIPTGMIISKLLKKSDAAYVANLQLSSCLLTNISICESSNKDKFVVVVYNPLGKNVNQHVRLPVNENSQYRIAGPDGIEIYDIFDSISTFDYIKNPTTNPSTTELVFKAQNLPPLGLKLYFIEKIDSVEKNENVLETIENIIENTGDSEFGTEENGFTIDKSTNLLNSITINGLKLEITQEFLYYLSDKGQDGRPSGAYVFRPDGEAKTFNSTINLEITRGKLIDEVKQIINEQITQIIRVYKQDNTQDCIEFDWLVGDIDPHQFGSEIITRFSVKNFNNREIFYTDSNGREMMKRQLNKRNDFTLTHEEPISSNYYPVTSKLVIRDEDRNLEVAILNDRAQGATSLKNGQIEFMIHRRLILDDGLGVDEVLNEKEFDKGLFVRGQHYLTLGPIVSNIGKSAAAQGRDLALRKLLPPLILLGDANSEEEITSNFNLQFQGLTENLPENLHLLTLEPWLENSFLLRLEHPLEIGDDDTLSTPVAIKLKNLLIFDSISEITEMKLGGNQLLSDEENQRLIWNNGDFENDELEIILNPMEIRTFVIKVGQSSGSRIPFNIDQLQGDQII